MQMLTSHLLRYLLVESFVFCRCCISYLFFYRCFSSRKIARAVLLHSSTLVVTLTHLDVAGNMLIGHFMDRGECGDA